MNRKYNLLASAVVPSLLVAFLCVTALADRAPEVPPGTVVKVRMIDNLNSNTSQIGDTFHGTLEEAIEVNGKELYPKGADVSGHVVDVHRSGRLSEPGELNLILTTVTSGSRTSSLAVQPLVIKGESHTKSNVGKIGGGAALGAIIGGIAGGGKGAAVGAGVGAAAGTGAAAATGKREATVESEAVLTFVTTSATSVTSGTASAGGSSTSDTESTGPGADGAALFTLRDRRVIRNCLSAHGSELPPGTTQREELPSGSERQLHRDGTLPSDVQKRIQSLPLACVEQLPELPDNMDRVVYKGRVMLVDNNNRILDLFYLNETQ